ncbi:MAG: 50S ribosomal protein L19 [Candidatus Omnitrophica bacterium]|nr:50S ribosomal protein L19 [Candidatus Omnitrophota bacterium]
MKATDVIDQDHRKAKVPDFRVGDTLKINLKVKEGDKSRIQIFEGICIRRRGIGVSASFTVLKETHGDIVEKVFPLYSPTIEKITVAKKGNAKRAKLYHLRKK